MYGPYKKLRFSRNLSKSWGILEPRKSYRVIKSFNDCDGDSVEEGFTFEYLGYDYFPHDEGLTLFIKNKEGNYDIRLQNSENQQAAIVKNLSHYFQPIDYQE